MSNAVDREFRLALGKLHILHHAAKHPVYGLWMLRELSEHGHRLSPGTLYPILARMKSRGWLERRGNATHARARKVFRITTDGRRVLEHLRRDVTELYDEVVCGREPQPPEPGAGQRASSGKRHLARTGTKGHGSTTRRK
ncbi:MAG: transcriptional regulator PadR family [Deltaproteobacteria bacterium]|nr:transcriptional regulator PadR family [Deltaproteobacteria bacterium]MBP1774522.1 transcriptional regulator PadR family [candidate division NC10 bacterium]